jgi:hypothetical protein
MINSDSRLHKNPDVFDQLKYRVVKPRKDSEQKFKGSENDAKSVGILKFEIIPYFTKL